MNPSNSPNILHQPPDELKAHSARLLDRIAARIAQQGPIPFSAFMEMALYEPGLGYYSAGLQKFGAEGDFVTAPELGDVFGACLARQVEQVGETLDEIEILEIGAGSGRLAADLLLELDGRQQATITSYRILERSAHLRAVQSETLSQAGLAGRVEWLDAPPGKPWKGIIIANEVIDALAAERFVLRDGAVHQVCVDMQEGALKLSERSAPEELDAAVQALGPLPDGYCSEVCLLLPPWLKAVTESLDAGVALFIDYGYPRAEYYRPERRDGTLIAHYQHRAHNNLLRYPGLQDLTAFVDFTAVAEAGQQAGLELLGYTSQALFLMSCGLDEVVHERLSGDTEQDMKINNQVRHLMLPGMMGEKFQVMALGRGWPGKEGLRGFSFRDLSGRL